MKDYLLENEFLDAIGERAELRSREAGG